MVEVKYVLPILLFPMEEEPHVYVGIVDGVRHRKPFLTIEVKVADEGGTNEILCVVPHDASP